MGQDRIYHNRAWSDVTSFMASGPGAMPIPPRGKEHTTPLRSEAAGSEDSMYHVTNGVRRHCAPAAVLLLALCLFVVGVQAMTASSAPGTDAGISMSMSSAPPLPARGRWPVTVLSMRRWAT